MNYSENYKLNKPQRNEQFNLDHWNENTDKIDSAMNTNRTNIANNASNISTILTGLSTINTSDTNSVYYKLMKLIYPVGSIYWSSKSTNPGTLFGGTWTQIKDKFVLACGNTYKTTGATGGASTVTLSVSNMPNHTHSFTPSGTVGSHTHSFTPSGSVSSTFKGTTGTTGSELGNMLIGVFCNYDSIEYYYKNSAGLNILQPKEFIGEKTNLFNSSKVSNLHEKSIMYNLLHNHKYTPSGNVSSTFTGTAGTTGGSTPTFTGTAGTTGANGSGSSFSILPPYIVKYCWERTA